MSLNPGDTVTYTNPQRDGTFIERSITIPKDAININVTPALKGAELSRTGLSESAALLQLGKVLGALEALSVGVDDQKITGGRGTYGWYVATSRPLNGAELTVLGRVA